MRHLKTLALSLLLYSCSFISPSKEEYHLVNTIPVGGSGGWDLVKVDEDNRRVYVTHTNQVEALDADSGKIAGTIKSLHGVHGIAFSHDLDRGFITNGSSDTVTLFDLKTLKVLGEVKTGKKPDAIASDEMTHRLLAFNGDSHSATVIDEAKGKKIGTIALDTGPELAVSDDQGHVFVNLEDAGETLMLDVAKQTVIKRWKVAPGNTPTGLALDKANHRLFIGCRNKLLVVMNSDTGEVITSLPIGDHVDTTMYDPVTHDIISSNGDGTLSIIKQDDADHYHTAQTVVTRKGSKTFALDEKTHALYVPAADFTPPPPPSKNNPKGRPAVVPGSFVVLVYGQ